MNIHGLTVSVGYADMLALGIGRWLSGLESLTVVTDLKDHDTPALCQLYGVACYRTDVFYERGATFGKAQAMNAARPLVPSSGWHLFFDADIVPPVGWASALDGITPGNLYGAIRHQAKDASEAYRTDLPPVPKDELCCGFFQLFAANDPLAAAPLESFTSAGVYDSLFSRRWGPRREVLPLHVVHCGPINQWFGRGNTEAFAAMQAERKRRGNWEHERIG